MNRSIVPVGTVLCASLLCAPALAQRVGENTAARAEDAFGASIGGEQIGIYSPGFVRGFSALEAGNVRLGGLAIDQQAPFSDRLVAGLQMRVGLSAQSYPFPAPTGVADYALRQPGQQRVLSTLVRIGPLGGVAVEIDGQAPVSEQVSVAVGASVAADQNHWGGSPQVIQGALLARWTPSAAVEVTPFWSQSRVRDDEAQPLFTTNGRVLPPKIPRATLLGQPWAQNETVSTNAGVLARLSRGRWVVRGGLFHSAAEQERGYTQLFLGVDPALVQGTEAIIAEPGRRFAALSGEVRATRTQAAGNLLHTLHVSARGRLRERRYGGADLVVLGTRRIGEPGRAGLPAFRFGPQTRDRVEQTTLGLAYELRWRDVGEMSLGIQHTDYTKTIQGPQGALPASVASPVLLNATVAAYLSPSLALYAGYTEGLEESPVAPDNAANREQTFAAISTLQRDAGVRWVIRPGMRLVAGLFQVEKPWFGLDPAGVFAQRGRVVHRGLEMSFVGQLGPQWLVVAGTSLIDPRVDDGIREDLRPIASFRRLSTAVIQHRPAAWPATTFDLIAESSSDRVANADASLLIPARTTLSFGIRHRFTVAGNPASVRALLANATDVFGFGNTPGGIFVLNQPRRFSLTLTVDW